MSSEDISIIGGFMALLAWVSIVLTWVNSRRSVRLLRDIRDAVEDGGLSRSAGPEEDPIRKS
jgi:hypothetical protein